MMRMVKIIMTRGSVGAILVTTVVAGVSLTVMVVSSVAAEIEMNHAAVAEKSRLLIVVAETSSAAAEMTRMVAGTNSGMSSKAVAFETAREVVTKRRRKLRMSSEMRRRVSDDQEGLLQLGLRTKTQSG